MEVALAPPPKKRVNMANIIYMANMTSTARWLVGYHELRNPGIRDWRKRAREGERERVEKCCFCLQNDLKEP